MYIYSSGTFEYQFPLRKVLLMREIFRKIQTTCNIFIFQTEVWLSRSVRVHLSSFGRYLRDELFQHRWVVSRQAPPNKGWKGMKRVQCRGGIAAHAFHGERFPCIRESRGAVTSGGVREISENAPSHALRRTWHLGPETSQDRRPGVCVCARARTLTFF